ncbi:MAG: c-type cytochrome biogenesis protein CcmI [Rubrimonas sp.]
MSFAVVALAAALLVALWVARPLALARRTAKVRAAHDEQVFRDQLAEIARDRERGLLSAEDAEGARIEISRRLLAAAAERAATPDHQPAPRLASYGLAAALLVAAPLGGWTLYGALGAPGLPDQPAGAAQARPGQQAAEAELARRFGAPPAPEGSDEFAASVAQLEARLAGPDADPEGLRLLAQSQARLGRHDAAWRSWERLIDGAADDATAAMFSAKAESMILAAQGYVSPEAEDALTQALRRAPADPVARFYMGAALAQTSQTRAAFDMWTGLIADSPEGAPWVAATRAQIEDLARRLGRPTPPIPAPRAPTDAELQAMTADMISQIERAVEAQGAPAGEWLQLVLAYDLLGQPDLAETALTRARSALAPRPAQSRLFDAALAEAPRAAGPAPLRAAIDSLGATVAARPDAAAVWLRLVATHAALGRFDAARDAAFAARDAMAGAPEALADFSVAIGGPLDVPSAAGPGPDADAMAAAAEMTPEERAEMVRGMVEGLRERLFADGGAPEDWARLIQAYGVIGDADAATEAFRRARDAFADDPLTVSALAERAVLAGASIE